MTHTFPKPKTKNMEKKNQEASGKKSFTESKFSSLGKTAGTFKGIGMESHALVKFDNTIAKVDRLAFPEVVGETFLKKSWKLLCYPDYSEN